MASSSLVLRVELLTNNHTKQSNNTSDTAHFTQQKKAPAESDDVVFAGAAARRGRGAAVDLIDLKQVRRGHTVCMYVCVCGYACV